MSDDKEPDSRSSDFEEMQCYWRKVDALLGGADAMRKASAYLPKFPNETDADYKFRLSNAKFTNIFGDIVETLASKPFGTEITITGASARVESFVEDIDGHGSHLHQFAAQSFYAGLAYALDWIFVDYTKNVPPGATVAQEAALGARPYWVHIPAQQMIAVYSEMIGGVETIVHARIAECSIQRDGWGEKKREFVRVLDRKVTRDDLDNAISAAPAIWELWEEIEPQNGQDKETWVRRDRGSISIGVIPIVPFIAGRRIGSSWRLKPVLKDAAELQIEHFQQESALKYAREVTAFPMLAGNGVTPAEDATGNPKPVPVGPKTVLYAPMDSDGNHGEWKFIEPSAESLRFLADEVKATEEALRELGRQPLTAQSGNITVVTAAFAGDKAISVIEALKLNFKNALENALALTAKWVGETDSIEVEMSSDDSLDLRADDGSADLVEMRKNNDLSQETLWSEFKRRGKLSSNFDAEKERQLLLDEAPGDPTAAEADAAAGNNPGPAIPASSGSPPAPGADAP
ncbi:MAG TPA: DUF4055 domain-containing protein [Methylosinus sp.]|uniref:DUF4055 domain-containing protein n=1 Tax=Methylosinus sp. TaxID=427 RepID=UPI002F952492